MLDLSAETEFWRFNAASAKRKEEWGRQSDGRGYLYGRGHLTKMCTENNYEGIQIRGLITDTHPKYKFSP